MANGVLGANSVLPQVIVTTALPALARQVREVEQRNPRKQSTACQSTKTVATNVVDNQYSGEQIAKSRRCNVLQSKVSQAASEADSAQGDVFHGSNQIAQCQSMMTRASNVAGNAAANVPVNQDNGNKHCGQPIHRRADRKIKEL
jgi:hypothetical protein